MRDLDKIRGAICQKILPLTYDESVSYYEFLCKILKKINEMLVVINEFEPQDLTEIYERLSAVETVNESQQLSIDELLQCCQDVKDALVSLVTRIGEAERRIDSVSDIVTIHTAELQNHEERITELEKYQSQLLLKKEYAIEDDAYAFDIQAEEYEREDY